MPGIGVEMDGAVQQAPQPGRQFIARLSAGRHAAVLRR
jgi:hypothetical protein